MTPLREVRAAVRLQRLTKRDRALLAKVGAAEGSRVAFTYAPRGRYARLVESPAGMGTRERCRLHALTKLGYLAEELHGHSVTVNLDYPQHMWEFTLTSSGRRAIS